MVLMIFVNDLWSLHGIPGWLEHAKAGEDALGLADIVFPAFLFIVGLSIPIAIESRRDKGEGSRTIFLHIVFRSLALIVMGFFMVNHESFRNDIPRIYKAAWEVIMVLAFLLIWNSYRDRRGIFGLPAVYLRGAGVFLLLILAALFRGGSAEDPEWMRPHWWGILGLIGWAYLLCALVFLFGRSSLWLILLSWTFLLLLNVQEFEPLPGQQFTLRLVVSASNHFLVMSGVLATVLYRRLTGKGKDLQFSLLLIALAAACIAFGLFTRPEWGISKISATPSWTTVCAGISFVSFALLYWICDRAKFTAWASPIMPAGRSTLTCYLVPYVIYPVFGPLLAMLPLWLTGGIPGLVKSLVFSFLVVLITGQLEKRNIRLKI